MEPGTCCCSVYKPQLTSSGSEGLTLKSQTRLEIREEEEEEIGIYFFLHLEMFVSREEEEEEEEKAGGGGGGVWPIVDR